MVLGPLHRPVPRWPLHQPPTTRLAHAAGGLALTRQPGSGFQQLVWQVCQQSLGRNTEEDGGDRGQQAPAHVAAKPGRDAERRRSPGQGDPASPRYSRSTGKQRTLQPPCPFVLGKHQAAPPLGHAHGSRPPPSPAVLGAPPPRARETTFLSHTATHASLWKRRVHTNSRRALPMVTATLKQQRPVGRGPGTQRWVPTTQPQGQGDAHREDSHRLRLPLTVVFTARYIRAPKVWANLPRTSWSSPKRSKVTSGLQEHQVCVCGTRGRGSFSNPWATKGQPAPWRRLLTARSHVAPTAMRRRRQTDTRRVEHRGSTARLRPRPRGTCQQPAIRDRHRGS